MSAVKAPRLLKTADCKQEHTISHVLSTNKSDNVLGLLNARQADALPNCPSLRTSQFKHAHPLVCAIVRNAPWLQSTMSWDTSLKLMHIRWTSYFPCDAQIVDQHSFTSKSVSKNQYIFPHSLAFLAPAKTPISIHDLYFNFLHSLFFPHYNVFLHHDYRCTPCT